MRTKHLKPIAVALLLSGAALPAAGEDARPTAGFRREHVEIKEHLAHLDSMVGGLDAASPEEQRRTMAAIVKFLDEHIRSHAAWEEAHLYPLVDLRSGHGGGEPFTASMRYEHGIIGRAIDRLSTLANAPRTDVRAFARAADRTLGVIAAHFEKEEEVFLPLLDRAMTRAELDAALGKPVH